MTVYTSNKGWTLPTPSGSSGTWGTILNNNAFAVIDNNLGAVTAKTLSSSNVTLSAAETESLIIRCSGTISANITITLTPETGSGITYANGFWLVENLTSGAFTVSVTNGVGSSVAIPQGKRYFIVADHTNGCRIIAGSELQDLATAGVIKRSSAGVLSTDPGTTNLVFAKDYNGNVVTTGIQGDIVIPFACTITGVTLLANASGSMVCDLWKAAYASYPPTVSNTITASAKPTLSSAAKYNDTSLTGWTTAVSAGDIIRVNVDSASTITRFTLALTVTRY